LHLRSLALGKAKEEELALATAAAEYEAAVEAQVIAQTVARQMQQAASDDIANIVTHCLAAVFDDPYKFVIQFERKRGKTEAGLWFKRGPHLLNPWYGVGGGVLDVAAWGLRLAVLTQMRPQPRPLLVLDEPFRFVHSPRYRARVQTMLSELPKRLGVQVLMVTGVEELVTGKVIQLE
jgi:hypothetical protein